MRSRRHDAAARHPLDLPAILVDRRRPEQQRAEWDRYWAAHPLQTFVQFAPRTALPDDVAKFKAEIEAERLTASRNRIAKMKAKQSAQVVDHATMRWDPAKGRFVIDPYLVRVAATAPPEKLEAKRTIRSVERPKAIDDLGTRVVTHTTTDGKFDGVKLRKFAEANGVWQERYVSLNNGLQRMNVVNRLRGKVKTGHVVVWS